MEIKTIEINSKTYLDFIKGRGTVYNTTEWLSIYKSNCKTMGVYEGEDLLAVFNVYVFKKSILSFCIPPPYSPDCALVVKKAQQSEKIIASINEWLELKKNSAYSQLRFCFSYKQFEFTKSLKPKNFEQKKNHTYVLDLSSTEDVQSLYAPKRRQQIRRAIKDELQVERVSDMKIVYELVIQTFLRQKKSLDQNFVKKILFEFANTKNSFAFATLKNGKPIIAYFCIHHNKEAFYLMGGYDENEKHIGAGPLAMNACIEHAKKIGITTYDFEGSMEPSIEKYFKEFGGVKKYYSCFEKSSAMGEMAVKLKKLIKK
ncbi:MAG: GNAT family N-acetyltransferase [Bacteroidetes bacterium]|nr:GNAT family N-acetyltransferase [Bacteroidota bacterium]